MSPREKGIKEFLRKKYFHAYGKLRPKKVRLPPRTKFQGQLRCHAFSRGFSHLFRAELGALLVILHFMPTFISLNFDDYVTVLSSLRVGTIFKRVFC